jgi:hypothetical protein
MHTFRFFSKHLGLQIKKTGAIKNLRDHNTLKITLPPPSLYFKHCFFPKRPKYTVMRVPWKVGEIKKQHFHKIVFKTKVSMRAANKPCPEYRNDRPITFTKPRQTTTHKSVKCRWICHRDDDELADRRRVARFGKSHAQFGPELTTWLSIQSTCPLDQRSL